MGGELTASITGLCCTLFGLDEILIGLALVILLIITIVVLACKRAERYECELWAEL